MNQIPNDAMIVVADARVRGCSAIPETNSPSLNSSN